MKNRLRPVAMLTTALAGLLGLAGSASADVIPYPSVGTYKDYRYQFTATTTGDLSAYYVSKSFAYASETLGLLVNYKDTGITGLNNQTSKAGDRLDFGQVNAGDVLTFVLKVDPRGYLGYTNPYTLYSDRVFNDFYVNQIYSTDFSGNALIPAGKYVGFEDLNPFVSAFPDFNYADEQFVFTNTSIVPSTVPLPASAPMFGAALLALGSIGYGLKRKQAAAAA